MTIHKITEELIRKFLDGNCTLEEKASVILWYNHFDDEEDVLLNVSQYEKDRLKDLMLDRINSRIDFSKKETTKKSKIRPLIYWASGIAAALLIFFGLSLYQKGRTNNVAAANQKIIEAKVYVLENQGGTLYERKLEDGTVIWLSPGARVEFPDHFAENTREVTMVGKVFFEVAKNPKRPFIIYAGGVTTKVLGTSFLVNAEKGKNTEVSVVTGKVAVSVDEKAEENILLLPKQKGVFNATDNQLKKESLPEKSEVQMWEKPKLSFDNVKVGEVVNVLAANFNVVINTNDEIKSCRLKADFNNQNLANILDMLCKSIDANYKIEGNNISINGRGCNN